MNKLYKHKIIILAIASIAVSCSSFSEINEFKIVEPISINIKTSLNIGEAPVPTSFQIKLISYTENQEYNVNAGAHGEITVNDIIPGIYTITVTHEQTLDDFTYFYTGNVVNTYLVETNQKIEIPISVARAGALVFKELYWTGSRTPANGMYFRDQFYEIYNNSEIEMNVRNLAMVQLAPLNATATPPVWPDEVKDDYVFALAIWQVPDDRDYPLQPGESIIICQMADDHRKESLNPACPVNLITAEFETFVANTAIIQDNPAINMHMAFWQSVVAQWLTPVNGGAFALYNPGEQLSYGDPTNEVYPVGSTSRHYKVPIQSIIDAVECLASMNSINLKRVPILLDAGAVSVEETYNGKSASRVVREVKEDGRVVYQDTNNSTEDFEINDTPVIRRNGAKAPSWNTWINNYK